MGLDPKLEKKFQELEKGNRALRSEVSSLKSQQPNQGGNIISRHLGLNIKGDRIAHKEWYLPHRGNPSSQGVPSQLSAERLFGKPKKWRFF